MNPAEATFNRVAVVTHPKIPESTGEALEICTFLQQSDIEALHSELQDERLGQLIRDGEIDLLIALGGDGTMLRAGHLCGPNNVPILGINYGHFGFLIEIRQKQWRDFIPRLLKGDYWCEKRMMLTTELFHKNNPNGKWEVLNEAVVGRGQMVHPVQLETYLDRRLLTTYVADALIVATATGSTAYALAVGGPILPPELRNICLIAVAPHFSIDRAIVLAEGASVSVTVHTGYDAVLCLDGQNPIAMSDGDQINVHASNYNVQFIRFQDPGYFYRNLTPHMSKNPTTGISA
jgi:NAD+ kinase